MSAAPCSTSAGAVRQVCHRVTLVDKQSIAIAKPISVPNELAACRFSGEPVAKRPLSATHGKLQSTTLAKRRRGEGDSDDDSPDRPRLVQSRIDDGRRLVSSGSLSSTVQKLCELVAAAGNSSVHACGAAEAVKSDAGVLVLLQQLKGVFCTAEMLEESRAGAVVFRLCKSVNPTVAAAASELYAIWRSDLHGSSASSSISSSAVPAEPSVASTRAGLGPSRGRSATPASALSSAATSTAPHAGRGSSASSCSSSGGGNASGKRAPSSGGSGTGRAKAGASAASGATKVHTLGAAWGIAGADGPAAAGAGAGAGKPRGRSASTASATRQAAAARQAASDRPISAASGRGAWTAGASNRQNTFADDDGDGCMDDRDGAASSGAAAREPLPFTRSGGVGLSMMDAVDIDAEVDAWADADRLAARRRKSSVPPPTKLPATSLAATAPAMLGLRRPLLASGSEAAAAAPAPSAPAAAAVTQAAKLTGTKVTGSSSNNSSSGSSRSAAAQALVVQGASAAAAGRSSSNIA